MIDRKVFLAGTAAAAAGAAGALAGGIAAVRAADARWAAAHDPIAPQERLLPPGDALTVRTDDGAELAVTVAGPEDARTVVLPHCWTGGREVWAPVAHRLLREGSRVVLYDQRGHGSSTTGEEGFTIPRLGHDLRTVLEEVDARRTTLAGHSMGGMTIQSLAAEHLEVVDERVRAIVLVATAASGLGGYRRDTVFQRAVSSRAVDRLLRSSVGHALVRGTVGRAVAREHLVMTRDLFLACDPEVRVGWLSSMQAMDLREGIAEIGVPVTVVAGTRDLLTPRSRAKELAEVIPGANLVTLPDRGHMLPLEAPDELADLIAAAAAAEEDEAAA
jgi:non-heme chloroperoxidase